MYSKCQLAVEAGCDIFMQWLSSPDVSGRDRTLPAYPEQSLSQVILGSDERKLAIDIPK